MDLSRVHFYKTIEEAETAIKQCSKEHYFIRVNRPRTNKKNAIRRESSPTNKKKFNPRETFPTNKKKFIRRDSRRIKIILFVGDE